MKGWKTLLFALLVAIGGVVQAFDWATVVPQDKTWSGSAMIAIGAIIAVLRVVTNTDVGRKMVMAIGLTAAATLLLAGSAKAADNLPAGTAAISAAIKAPALTAANCTIANCSGFYAGAGLTGNGTNADILGNGINQSVFAAGGILDAHAGYQMWNGTYLFGFEVGLGNEFSNGPISNFGSKTLVGYEEVKLGGALSNLINTTTGTTASGQAPGPLTVPSSFANVFMAPYVSFGAMQRGGYNEWVTGAGMEFVLAKNWNMDVGYRYAPATGSIGSLNMVTIGLNYYFSGN
jgi:hypothetical protein